MFPFPVKAWERQVCEMLKPFNGLLITKPVVFESFIVKFAFYGYIAALLFVSTVEF